MVKNKIYLDTNIVADMIDPSRRGHKSSVEFLKESIVKHYTICISEDMLSTLYYISKNKTATLNFFKNIIMIDWQVLPFGKDVIAEGIDLSLENDLDLEDILQCLCAKKSGCETLITNDKVFYDCGVSIYGMADFISKEKVLCK